MKVYRLVREQYATDLSGKGAAKYGARWNSIGTELIYAAANRSLAMAEVAVHLTLATLPSDFLMVIIEIPDHLAIETLDSNVLPVYWNQFPPVTATQRLGDTFVAQNKYVALKVPSAVTKGDFNYLINPAHTDYGQIRIISKEVFPFDRRIFES